MESSDAESEISKEEKEKILSDKMLSIRRKNEELRKRHEEIEADKRLADKHSASVQMEEVKPYIMKLPRPKHEKFQNSIPVCKESESNSSSQESTSRQRLKEKDVPPPDPAYRFLADPDRDGTEVNEKSSVTNQEESDGSEKRGRGRGRPGRGGRVSNNRGRGYGRGARGRYNEDGRRPNSWRGRGGEPAYDQWKAERNAIDEARISRARSGDGEWTREWDLAKIDQKNGVVESEYEQSFNQRSRGDSFKLKDMLPDEIKVKLENQNNRPIQKRGGRGYRGARQVPKGSFSNNNEHQQQNNWRERNVPNSTNFQKSCDD